jgi:hypothetical protein
LSISTNAKNAYGTPEKRSFFEVKAFEGCAGMGRKTKMLKWGVGNYPRRRENAGKESQ